MSVRLAVRVVTDTHTVDVKTITPDTSQGVKIETADSGFSLKKCLCPGDIVFNAFFQECNFLTMVACMFTKNGHHAYNFIRDICIKVEN